MASIADEAKTFRQRKTREIEEAGQTAAFFLLAGIDLSTAVEARGDERKRIVARLERLIERERLKGARRHWSYDLNRHIALRQVLLRLRGEKQRPARVRPRRRRVRR